MIPQGGVLPTNQPVTYTQQTSRTYRWDQENKRIVGMVDGIEAVKQAVYKILSSERFHYMVYSWLYGTETQGLIGEDTAFIRSELKRRVSEALLQDDRINAIEDMQVTVDGDRVLARFTVVSLFGRLQAEKAVRRGV